jgi:hypothetical protein
MSTTYRIKEKGHDERPVLVKLSTVPWELFFLQKGKGKAGGSRKTKDFCPFSDQQLSLERPGRA